MFDLEEDIDLLEHYQTSEDGWNEFAKDVLNVRLDWKQRKILKTIQHNPKVSIRSGNGRGKDYVVCIAAICFLYLRNPSKVVLTGPTYRQVIDIMMAEIKKLHKNAAIPLGGIVLNDHIKFEEDPTWYLVAFRAKDSADKSETEWSGYHSPNLMVVVTEASGVDQFVFNAIEGILTGESKEVLTFNPTRVTGEAYQSSKSNEYIHFRLNSLNAVNVRAKKVLIPGQVDWKWINSHVDKAGWTTQIDKSQAREDMFDFCWNDNKWYRPSTLFLVKILGEFPRESEDTLIPLTWIEAANRRWYEWEKRSISMGPLKLGVDVAGMGRDSTVFTFRRGSVVERFKEYSKQDHMITVGKVKNELVKDEDFGFVDALGEGAGVFSRLVEQKVNVFGFKSSFSAKGLSDATGQRNFANMRAFVFWCIRDSLDPSLNGDLALPPSDELTQELSEVHYIVRSNGEILMEEKEEIKKRIGRSPDYADSLATTFFRQVKKPEPGARFVSFEDDD